MQGDRLLLVDLDGKIGEIVSGETFIQHPCTETIKFFTQA